MDVTSVEDGLAQLDRIVAAGHKEGQFYRASVLLQATVKQYAANVDDFYTEVMDFKLSLSRRAFTSSLMPRTNKLRNKRTEIKKPLHQENDESDFEKIASSFGLSIDLASDNISNPERFRQHMAFDHFWNGLRFDPKSFNWPDIQLFEVVKERRQILEMINKYHFLLASWAMREEPIPVWTSLEEEWTLAFQAGKTNMAICMPSIADDETTNSNTTNITSKKNTDIVTTVVKGNKTTNASATNIESNKTTGANATVVKSKKIIDINKIWSTDMNESVTIADIDKGLEEKERRNSQLSNSTDSTEMFDMFSEVGFYQIFSDESSTMSDDEPSPGFDSAYGSFLESSDLSNQPSGVDDQRGGSPVAEPSGLAGFSKDIIAKDMTETEKLEKRKESVDQEKKRRKRMKIVKPKKDKIKRPRFKIMDLDAPIPKTKLQPNPGPVEAIQEQILSNDSAVFVDNYDDFGTVESFQNVENFQIIEKLNLELGRKKKSKVSLKHDESNNEAGFCMRKYRNKVLAWFLLRDQQDFAAQMAGQPRPEISRHLLALLHLVNEQVLEISSECMTMDKILITKI